MYTKLLIHLLFFLMLCTTVASASYSSSIKLVFAYEDKQNYPFYLDSKKINWEKPGVSIELLKKLESELPVRLEFKRQPWKRCKYNLKNGAVDGIFNASFSTERMKIGVYPMINGSVDISRRITTLSYYLYKFHTSSVIWDDKIKSIRNMGSPICAPLGYSIVKNLKKWGIPVVEKNHVSDCFRILSFNNGKISGVATLEFDGDLYLTKNDDKIHGIKKVMPPLVSKPYYLMLSHQFVSQHPELAEQIWDTVKKLRKAWLEPLLKKY
ncbi:MAG: amino acid ABC transporter substrate-binding protein [Desulfobacterales bacterium]|nr:amino acid ABC transporter substrate-binding protein [Desulfobacterales bacterium]